jgi:protein tyrosine/serine phosphatase
VPKLRLVAQFGKGVIREFGERVFSEIHQQYGTLEAYFAQEYGLDADGLAEFRARYLVAPEAPARR